MRKVASKDGIAVMDETIVSPTTNDETTEKLLPLHHATSDHQKKSDDNHDASLDLDEVHPQPPSQAKKIGTALFYAGTLPNLWFVLYIYISSWRGFVFFVNFFY